MVKRPQQRRLPKPDAETTPLPAADNGSDQPLCRWRCPNCGQMLFTHGDESPPDTCDYCDDMTTWQRVE